MEFARDLKATERMIALEVGMQPRFNGYSNRPHQIGFMHDIYAFGGDRFPSLVSRYVKDGISNDEAGQRLIKAVSICRNIAKRQVKFFNALTDAREAVILLLIYVNGKDWFTEQKELKAAINSRDYGKVQSLIEAMPQDKLGVIDMPLLVRRWKANSFIGMKRGDLPDGWVKGQR